VLEADEVPAPAVRLVVGVDLADQLIRGRLGEDRRQLRGGGGEVLGGSAGPVVTVSGQQHLPLAVLDRMHCSQWLVRELRAGPGDGGRDEGPVLRALEKSRRVVDAGRTSVPTLRGR
jgi:hypothetical protein